jgi:Spy/CpxP family protein refolding chaperone
MNARFLNRLALSTLLATAIAAGAQNPGKGPGGPPPGGPPPGGYNPSANGQANPNGSRASSSVATTSKSSEAARSGFQLGPVGRWWDDKSVVRSIGLRQEQQQKMDAIFNANKPSILESYKTFLNEQAKLAKLNKDPKADQASIFAAIDAVSKARTGLQKATTQMLLQIRQQMDAEQIAKLEKLQ